MDQSESLMPEILKKSRGRPRKISNEEEKEKRPRGRPRGSTKIKKEEVEKKPKGRPVKHEDKTSEEYLEVKKAYHRTYYHAHPKAKEEIIIRPLSTKNPDLTLNKRIKNHVHHLNYIKKHDKNDQKFSKYDDVEPKMYTFKDPEDSRITFQTYVNHSD
jgi:hypothetical protein